MRAETAAATKAVVAIWVELVPPAAVGAVGTPVSAGEANDALASSAACRLVISAIG
jgi:hypothetical protein